MVAAGQFGHHTAILGVNVDLGIECVRQQAPLGVIQRHPGLITAGFYAQYLHDIALYRFTPTSTDLSGPAWDFSARRKPFLALQTADLGPKSL